ncbi:MAG: hypothetical protein L0G57_10465, partial [Acinetobacter sp.]|nr:hypothetical protein [Acinetobacter sp.]
SSGHSLRKVGLRQTRYGSPISLRTTGVGWSIGIARLGSVIGPLFGGYLSKHMDITHLFIAAAVPSMLVIMTLVIQAKYR